MAGVTPMIFALGSWLEDKCEALGLPAMLMDDLNATGESLCLSQTNTETVLKEYINGAKVGRLEVGIYAQGSIESKRALIEHLTSLVWLLEAVRDEDIDGNHRILRCRTTAPSMIQRTENDMVRYMISVVVDFKETR